MRVIIATIISATLLFAGCKIEQPKSLITNIVVTQPTVDVVPGTSFTIFGKGFLKGDKIYINPDDQGADVTPKGTYATIESVGNESITFIVPTGVSEGNEVHLVRDMELMVLCKIFIKPLVTKVSMPGITTAGTKQFPISAVGFKQGDMIHMSNADLPNQIEIAIKEIEFTPTGISIAIPSDIEGNYKLILEREMLKMKLGVVSVMKPLD